MKKEKFLSIQEVAEYLSVDPRTVRRYISSGHLTATRIGPRLIRIHEESVIQLVTKWKVGIR